MVDKVCCRTRPTLVQHRREYFISCADQRKECPMIMLARVVPYGGNAIRYALEKEKAKVVKVNHMPEGIDPTAIWYMMKHHCQLHQQDRTVGRKLERSMVSFVISPSKEEAKNFTMNDWANLHEETLKILDSDGLIPKGMDREVKTNFRNSLNVSSLHSDSKSGKLHLHMDCCRVDLEGNTNDVHDLHIRAMMAAEIINMRHGWKQPKEIRDMRKEEIKDFCEYTLQKMQEFDIDFYFKMLRMKASEVGRRFMATQLEATWKKLHPIPTQVRVKPATPTVSQSSHSVRPSSHTTISTQPKVQPKVHPKPVPFFTTFNINTPNGTKAVEIPNSVKDIFFNEAQIPEGNDTATIENVAHTAMLLFVGYIDAATSMSESCGGGGSSASESGWGKKDDEDERQYARRCLQMAHSICKPKPRQRSCNR